MPGIKESEPEPDWDVLLEPLAEAVPEAEPEEALPDVLEVEFEAELEVEPEVELEAEPEEVPEVEPEEVPDSPPEEEAPSCEVELPDADELCPPLSAPEEDVEVEPDEPESEELPPLSSLLEELLAADSLPSSASTGRLRPTANTKAISKTKKREKNLPNPLLFILATPCEPARNTGPFTIFVDVKPDEPNGRHMICRICVTA